ncbi:MAG TPA: DUF370 domain-containing protein [Firmicutes bacterium]|jgi:hypothetical protein|nr:DUF370 domain-containing protein [Bacillota bacterium]
MFLPIGPNKCIPLKEIIGIFTASTLGSAATDEFIRTASEEGFVEGKVGEAIKSFIVADESVYLSALVPETLRKRSLSRGRLWSD